MRVSCRDRAEELIHHGIQYSRAVRRYFKKFGRYPARIEDLENTNNFRFLRKRYKDPITGKDFKLLRLNDVQFALKPQLVPYGEDRSISESIPSHTAIGQIGPINVSCVINVVGVTERKCG